jgi:hypothetical protein
MRPILAIASGGGHWSELCRLLPVFEDREVVFASTYPDYGLDVPDHKFYVFCDFSRFSKRNIFLVLFQIVRLLAIVRPSAVITTGSAPAFIAIAIAKIFLGSRTIWIDSVANSNRLSSSGAAARYFADAWLTQWPHLAHARGPQYWGAVL